MLIACTTVAGATAVTSQFKKSLITELKGSSDYKEFLSKSRHTSKGPKIYTNTIVTCAKLPTQLLM